MDLILYMFSYLVGYKVCMTRKLVTTGVPVLCYLPLQLYTELIIHAVISGNS